MIIREQDIGSFNEQVENWTDNLMDELKDELDTLGVQHYKNSPNKTPLRKALEKKFYRSHGSINRIGIAMPRSAVFLHKGVGRSHPMANPRTPKKWFNPVIKRNIQDLQIIAAKYSASFIVDHIFIKGKDAK